MLNRSQRNFAHVTTVTLSWRVQDFVAINEAYLKLEHSKIWSNFEFDRITFSGTGARSLYIEDNDMNKGNKYTCAIVSLLCPYILLNIYNRKVDQEIYVSNVYKYAYVVLAFHFFSNKFWIHVVTVNIDIRRTYTLCQLSFRFRQHTFNFKLFSFKIHLYNG